MLTRRGLLAATAVTPVLFACSQVKNLTPAQVAADITGVVSWLSANFQTIVNIAPGAFAKVNVSAIEAGLQADVTALQNVASEAATAGAFTIQAAEPYITSALSAISAAVATVPALSAYALPIGAIAAVLPGVFAWVNSLLPPTTAKLAAAPEPAAVPAVPLAEARAILGIPVKP